MKTRPFFVGLLIVAMTTLPACRVRHHDRLLDEDLSHYVQAASDIEYPEVGHLDDSEHVVTPEPFQIQDYQQAEFWDLSVQDVIQLALANSDVLRDLGGTVLRSPSTMRTTLEPAIQETDPRFGIEAALSAFDTDLNTRIFAEQNDRRLNNRFLGDLGILRQNFGVWEAELKKRAATGSQFVLRKNVEFDRNTSLGNEFPNGAWTVILGGEVRQPLLQGAGLPFNRIAGPDGGPGSINGVLIARVKTDVSLAEFELGVRDLVSNVENAYWDLYFSYRDLDAKIKARDAALDTWRRIAALYQAGRRGGEAEKEAQAREQYFQFQLEVENALTGRLLEGTRTNNGSSGGTFRGNPGVYVAERRLRLAMGIPINDGRLIRPAHEPPTTRVLFDWGHASAESMFRRAELRRQKWDVKRREMELLASRNLLLPDLDFVGRYRFRGFGDTLINSHRNLARPDGLYDNAYQNLTTGDHQEWQMGFEFAVPLGQRQAHTAVRNAELQLARSVAILKEQEHQILHDLSGAIAEVDRAYTVMATTYNRLLAAKDQLDAVETAYEADKVEFFVVLDSQRRLATTASQFFQAQVEYSLALKNVHFEKGTLLDYCGVMLSEGPWPQQALVDAYRRDCRRGPELTVRATRHNPPVVSQGGYPQETLSEPGMLADPALGPGTQPTTSPAVPSEALPQTERATDPFFDDPYLHNSSESVEPPPMPETDPLARQMPLPVDEQPSLSPYPELVRKLERIAAGAGGPAPSDRNRQRVESIQANLRQQFPIDATTAPLDQPPAPQHGRWHAQREGDPTAVGRAPGGVASEPQFEFAAPISSNSRTQQNAETLRTTAAEPAARQFGPAAPSSTAGPRPHDGQHERAQVSLLMAPENQAQRAHPAGRWGARRETEFSIPSHPDLIAPPTMAAPPPTKHSVRLMPQTRAEQLGPRESSSGQIRFLPSGPARRLPPIGEGR